MIKLIFNTLTAFVVSLIIQSQAFAFMTVIDVEEFDGTITTIQSSSDYTLNQMKGKSVTYRGLAEEAVDLFEEIAEASAPGYVEVESEISETETLLITVKVQGLFGFYYSYWTLPKSGN